MADGSLLHRRISDALREQIERGELARGSRVPSERTLAEQFGVSRLTVRQALKDLELEGLVQVIGGIRWITRLESSIEEGGSGLVSFSDLAAANGFRVTSRVLTYQTRSSTLDEASVLGIAPGADVIDLARLRFLDGVPVVVDYTLIPEAVAPGLEGVDFTTESLYAILAERFGVHTVNAECVIEARGASPELAEYLGLSAGEPILEIIQLIYDDRGRVVQSGRSVYRGDRYRFRALLESGRGARRTVNRAVERVTDPSPNFGKVLR
ncbi:GntR family transcriptional regulator [Rhizohabitans arisaemae]|uniref:GntR family transcriptional regulator n=1 Tax=Rhizohabitans arisaemae TaxID=2720610 RepID=UPI0024B0D7FC|nr:GntR family transcriptional regulator [Rhizohabitans arisaemae]